MTRKWRGQSGQIWYEVDRIGHDLILVPEYSYDNSTNSRTRICFDEDSLEAIGFVRVDEGNDNE